MANYDYTSAGITGTSTTAKIFTNSGIRKAVKNKICLNPATGHVYICDTAGAPSVAKWKYVRTDIANLPNAEVSGLGQPVRTTSGSNTHIMKATWKVPSTLTNNKNGRRATGLQVSWSLGIKGTDPQSVKETSNESLTESKINLNNLKIGKTTYTRNSFYPNTTKLLHYVTVKVQATNSKGETKGVEATRKFTLPNKPSIGGFSFNSGTVSTTITSDAGNGYAERYDTEYTTSIYSSITKKTTSTTSTSTSTSIPVSYDYGAYQSLGDDQYIQITVSAINRGYKGKTDPVTKSAYISQPNAPTFAGKTPIETKADRAIVYIKTNASTQHPVTGVRLQYLANTTYSRVEDIPQSLEPDDYDVEDNANCTALVIDKPTIAPDAGKYSWVRIKTWSWDESVANLCKTSEWKRVTGYETKEETASDDKIVIASVVAGANGTSVKATLGFNNDGNTGTELSWSNEEDAWTSTEEPNVYEFTWFSNTPVTVGGTTYPRSAVITIKGLEPFTKYWIKARRYLDGNGTSYSQYASTTCNVSSDSKQVAESVTAMCRGIVPKGESLQVYWAFSSNNIQKDWKIVSTSDKVIASGSGSVGAAQVSAEALEASAVNGTVSFRVYASSGSEDAESNILTTTIMEKPSLSLNVTPTLTAQPFGFTATVSTPCSLMVIVTSEGAVGQFPTGIKRQTEGDTIYSDIIEPEWTAGVNNYTTTVTLPNELDFWDLGRYTVSVTAIDLTSGLRSDESRVSFDVDWTHKAEEPFDYVTITPIDDIDDTGQHIKAAQIELVPPTSCYVLTTDTEVAEGKKYYDLVSEEFVPAEPIGSENPSEEGWYELNDDVYDIYRYTGDGAVLIGESFPLEYTGTDLYAPFGSLITNSYRIALRTPDGDVNYSDIDYDADGDYLKFNWGGLSVDLPYSVSISDSYEKSVELRQHMDGSVDGYWNNNIMRRGSLSTDAIKIIQQNDINLVRQLARYAGAVFVRTPEGSAYEANVQVTDLSNKNRAVLSVAIDATEIGTTKEFMLPIPFVMETEE